MPSRAPKVLLLSLPWTTLTEPSLGLAILKAMLARSGAAARVRHLNLDLLRFLRPETYYALANLFALNDFLFSGVLERDVSNEQRRLLQEKAQQLLRFGTMERHERGGVDGVVAELLRLRNDVIPAWLEEVADDIARGDDSLIGFTCMFDQTVASLALARLVRERAPDKLIAFGGYAVRPPTAQALLRSFPWVDAVCSGEGERVVTGLAQASVAGGLDRIPGIVLRDATGEPKATPAPAPMPMDDVPTPDFEDFFRDVAELAARHRVEIAIDRLPVENSRGCWWGAKHHCIFCGIHDDDLRFRAKSAPIVLEQLGTLSSRHAIQAFRFSDYILPDTYYRTLLPELAERGRPYRLTSEMKANVSASRFAALAAAGFDEVQPGIESFATPVLRRIDKGVSGLQNIHTLLLGRRHGIRVHYNLLYGFPDDHEDDYERMAQLLPKLRHLDPPSTRLEVQITRFAPLQTDPARFDLDIPTHAPDYDLVFSRSYLDRTSFDLDDFCYYYARPFENSHRLQAIYRRLDALVDEWKAERRQREVALWHERLGDAVWVFDGRKRPGRKLMLAAAEAALLFDCTEPTMRHRLLAKHGGLAALARLETLGLIVEEADQLLSLVLPKSVYPSVAATHGASPDDRGDALPPSALAC